MTRLAPRGTPTASSSGSRRNDLGGTHGSESWRRGVISVCRGLSNDPASGLAGIASARCGSSAVAQCATDTNAAERWKRDSDPARGSCRFERHTKTSGFGVGQGESARRAVSFVLRQYAAGPTAACRCCGRGRQWKLLVWVSRQQRDSSLDNARPGLRQRNNSTSNRCRSPDHQRCVCGIPGMCTRSCRACVHQSGGRRAHVHGTGTRLPGGAAWCRAKRSQGVVFAVTASFTRSGSRSTARP